MMLIVCIAQMGIASSGSRGKLFLFTELGINTMIFVVETETRSLAVHGNEAAAICEYEGLDVEAALYLFWSDDGTPLEPKFTMPNKRGWFLVQNGRYCLEQATPNHHADLTEALDHVLYLEPNSYFSSLAEIRSYIAHALTTKGA